MTFNPVKTFQGTALSKIVSDSLTDCVALIGTGVQAKALAKRLLKDRNLAKRFIFVERNPLRVDGEIYSVKVVEFNQFIRDVESSSKNYLIIDPPKVDTELQELLMTAQKHGAARCSWKKLSRPEAIIEIASPVVSKTYQNIQGSQTPQFMSVEKFSAILKKLCADFRELHSIDLSGRSDPITHPHLTEIINLTSARTFCSIITNLNCGSFYIERLAASSIDQIIVDFSEIVSVQNLDTFLASLDELNKKVMLNNEIAEIRCRYQKRTRNLCFLPAVQEFCALIGVRLVTEHAYPDPYEVILKYVQTGISDEKIDEVIWDIDAELAKALSQREKPCLCQRIFPVVNVKAEVEVCHLYAQPKLSDNYLLEDVDQLVKKRSEFNQCHICQNHGLHRLDLEVLKHYFG